MDKDHQEKTCHSKIVNPSKYEAGGTSKEFKMYWKKVLQEITSEIKSPNKTTESRLMFEALPNDLYERVCKTLDIPRIDDLDKKTKETKEAPPRRLKKEPMLSFRKTLYIDREMDSDTDVEHSSSEEEKPNIHRELLKKPVREQITWATRYMEPEREDEKNLLTKSDDVTDRIVTTFCQYMTELGGNQQSQLFTPKAIKELFQIEFDYHVARGLKVDPKEMPSVFDKVALEAGLPEKTQSAVIEREVNRDIKVEKRPDLMRAFGTSLPHEEQWRQPRNHTKEMWRSARHVPKDLVTLKTVWEGITNLRSVREYCRWMIEHPEYRRAPYLRSIGMFDPAVLNARRAEETSNYELPTPSTTGTTAIDRIRRRLSQLADDET